MGNKHSKGKHASSVAAENGASLTKTNQPATVEPEEKISTSTTTTTSTTSNSNAVAISEIVLVKDISSAANSNSGDAATVLSGQKFLMTQEDGEIFLRIFEKAKELFKARESLSASLKSLENVIGNRADIPQLLEASQVAARLNMRVEETRRQFFDLRSLLRPRIVTLLTQLIEGTSDNLYPFNLKSELPTEVQQMKEEESNKNDKEREKEKEDNFTQTKEIEKDSNGIDATTAPSIIQDNNTKEAGGSSKSRGNGKKKSHRRKKICKN
jgi:predicted O-linked N-acetylglucosamine transferase (SPINDLY family)